jgi:hypothetical protein
MAVTHDARKRGVPYRTRLTGRLMPKGARRKTRRAPATLGMAVASRACARSFARRHAKERLQSAMLQETRMLDASIDAAGASFAPPGRARCESP